MQSNLDNKIVSVKSEINKLTKVLIHRPGGELNNMLSEKKDEWSYDDILDLEITQNEHSQFSKILLTFLDPEKIISMDPYKKVRYLNVEVNPNKENFHKSKKVIEAQYILFELFSDENKKTQTIALIEQVAALEKIHYARKVDLIKMYDSAMEQFKIKLKTNPEATPDIKHVNNPTFMDLVKTLISGKLKFSYDKDDSIIKSIDEEKAVYIFKPIPNFIFTRDIAVTLNDNILITKPANPIRHREVVLMKYIAQEYLINDDSEASTLKNIIEISEDDDYFQYDKNAMEKMKVTFEGGDIMMISDRHLLIGKSLRTSVYAINKLINRIFRQNLGIRMISVIQIEEKRSQMHIDTLFSQVNKNTWMLNGSLSKRVMDETFEREKYPYSHQQIIENKGADNIKEANTDINILQFFIEENFKDNDPGHADFFIYTKKELMNLNPPYNEEDINKLKLGPKEFEIYAQKDYEKVIAKDLNEFENRKKKLFKYTYEYIASLSGYQNFFKFQINSDNYSLNTYYERPNDIEVLLKQISRMEFELEEDPNVNFIYSGNKNYPFDEREQWTDSCNLLSLGNGVVIGYDRNRKTTEAFNANMLLQYNVEEFGETNIPVSNKKLYKELKKNDKEYFFVTANDLFLYIENNCFDVDQIIEFTNGLKDILITIPSGELSRARGGSHCMSMPLIREQI